MKFLYIGLIGLLLAACNPGEQVVIREKLKVVTIPESIYNECPALPKLPKLSGLTDIQVARLIVTLYGNNQKCKNAIEAIRTLLLQAESASL